MQPGIYHTYNRDVMADPWKSMKLAEFEHVLVSASVALLRVSGKPSRRHSRSAPPPVLLADNGEKTNRFAALPSPVDERGVLRAAYSVDSDLIAPATVFSLELASGVVLSLPAPSPGAARIIGEPDADPPADVEDGAGQPPGGDERRSDPESKLTVLSARVAEAEQARGGVRQVAAEAEAQRATAALAELEIWRGELERRLTETTDQLSAAKATLAEDERVMGRLRGELADAEAKVDLLQAQVQTLDEQPGAPADMPYATERATIVRQAGELASLLDNADRVAELAREFADARVLAERLQAAASAEPLAPVPDAPDPLRAALDEIEALRGQVLQAREAETVARIEAIRLAAEAEARELAERELVQAAFAEE